MRRFPSRLVVSCALLGSAACEPSDPDPPHSVIPAPMSIELTPDTFHLGDSTRIAFDEGDAEGERIATFLSDLIGNSPETRPEVVAWDGSSATDAIRFTREDADAMLGPEGYTVEVGGSGVVVRAAGSGGLFYGMQTVRHLLPPVVEYAGAFPQPLWLPGLRIEDSPRYPWRGLMLDVARHFLAPDDVKRFIDLASLYKVNRLHLHLADDQGWRVEIEGWPNLTEHGGSTEVGGGEGGFYTKAEYEDIVAYAAEHFMTVVPEIDMPGHINAALASYPELNCDGIAPELFTGTAVGFSAICVDKEITYDFLDDVIGQVADMSPGLYFHIGGDEGERLTEEQYVEFVNRIQGIVRAHGKLMIGWDEIAWADLEQASIVQLWRPLWGTEPEDSARAAAVAEFEGTILGAVESGVGVLLSPANRVYLDLKYDTTTALGLTWAGIPNTRDSYAWDPGVEYSLLPQDAIVGVESPLWGETVDKVQDYEFMAFPRLAGVAEIGWSAADARDWEEYRLRLGAQSARWIALGINFHRSPLVPWQVGPRDP